MAPSPNGVEGQEFPAIAEVFTRRCAFIPRGAYRCRLQLRRQFPRWHRRGDLLESSWLACGATGPFYPPRKDWDRAPWWRSISTTTWLTNFHDNAIEIDGIDAQHSRDAAPHAELRVAPVLQLLAIGGPVCTGFATFAYNAPFGVTRMRFRRRRRRVPPPHDVQRIRGADIRQSCTWRTISSWGRTSNPEVFAVHTFTNYSESDYNGIPAESCSRRILFQWDIAAVGHGAGLSRSPRDRTLGRQKTGDTRLSDARRVQRGCPPGISTASSSITTPSRGCARLTPRTSGPFRSCTRWRILYFRPKAGFGACGQGRYPRQVTDGYAGAVPNKARSQTGSAAAALRTAPA